VKRPCGNPKFQVPNPKEFPISNNQMAMRGNLFSTLKFGLWKLFGIWDLVLGISSVAGG
jgi:hypothetical protein